MIKKYKWKFPDIPLFNANEGIKAVNKYNSMLLDSVLTEYQQAIIQAAPVGASTQLRNSIQQEKISNNKGRIIVNAKYAATIEDGRKAAPVSASADLSLTAWVKRSIKGRKYFASLKQTYPKITVKQAVFLLKKGKKRKPTKKNPFFTRGRKKATPAVKKIYASYQARLTKEVFGL